MVNTTFMLRIVLGAAVTALGAAEKPASAVIIMDTVNNAIAGLLMNIKW